MATFLIGLMAALLISATVLIRYETLSVTGRLLPRLPIRPRQRVLVVIAACFVAHLVEILLYALAFAALHNVAGKAYPFESGHSIYCVAQDAVRSWNFCAAHMERAIWLGRLIPLSPDTRYIVLHKTP